MSTVPGLDVSHHNGASIDWQKVAGAGYLFAFCKATEGTGYIDPTHAHNVAAARAAGLRVGSYHYAKPDAGGPLEQAQHFAGQLGAMGPGRLPAALDLEETGGLTPARLQTWARAFLHELDRLTGRTSLLYTGRAFFRDQLEAMTGWPLWLARYGAQLDQRGVTFWQHSSAGTVPGITGAVDLNTFYGDASQLDALAGIHRPAPAPAPVPTQRNDDDMRIIAAAGRASILLGVKEPFVALTPAEAAAWRAAGATTQVVAPAQHDTIISSLQK